MMNRQSATRRKLPPVHRCFSSFLLQQLPKWTFINASLLYDILHIRVTSVSTSQVFVDRKSTYAYYRITHTHTHVTIAHVIGGTYAVWTERQTTLKEINSSGTNNYLFEILYFINIITRKCILMTRRLTDTGWTRHIRR